MRMRMRLKNFLIFFVLGMQEREAWGFGGSDDGIEIRAQFRILGARKSCLSAPLQIDWVLCFTA
jgi:hypothetical protein